MPNQAIEYLKLFFILFLFIATLYGAYYFSKKFKISGIKNFNNNGMKVLQGLYVGPAQSLQLVKIYDRYVIIAVTKENISLLMELDESEIVGKDGEILEQKVQKNFKEVFDDLLKKNK